MAKSVKRPSKKPGKEKILVATSFSDTREANELLEQVLENSEFWLEIERQRLISGFEKTDFKVLIKPDMEHYELNASTGTDPRLVEHLVDLLFGKGYENIVIADATGFADIWLENRDVIILADLIGYRFVTDNENPYDILSLSEEVAESGFPKGSALEDTGLSQHWHDAHFRINFCKNKSDEENLFALGLQNLINILPLRDKRYHYQNRLRLSEVGTALLEYTEVHFTIVDAFVSNHGSQGNRHSHPLETRTFIAGNNLLLTDWVAALKMGHDPYASQLNGHALRKIGLPKDYLIVGDLSNYPGWIGPSPLLRQSVHLRNRAVAINKAATPWMQTVDSELFPFKSILDEQINGVLTPLIKDIDDHPLVQWLLIGLNYSLANINRIVEGYQIMNDKDRMHRQKVSLGIDLSKYKKSDFDDIENYIRPLAQIVQHTPPDRNGIKWRYIDGSVLFEYSRILPIPYESFVEKVDIARAVQLMYDNIGGNQVEVRKGRNGRVVNQAERDIYLPQPNWMVFFGGKFIDVGKLELIRYGKTEQHIFWRTVNSQNDSAEYDDGMVTFAKSPGGTEITIVARQKFELPVFWQVFDMDYIPGIKNLLVSDSYVRFFSRTMANFEAVYEGRSSYIGKLFDEKAGEADIDGSPLISEQLENIFTMVSGLAGKWFSRDSKSNDLAMADVDEDGYAHFKGTPPSSNVIRGFLNDLGKSIQKDYFIMSNPKSDQT